MPGRMDDFESLMQIFSQPRPNGSRAERETAEAIKKWLLERGIPFKVHRFRQYPYYMESLGAWMIVSRTLLILAVWFRWGRLGLAVALIGTIGGLADLVYHIPLVTWPGARWAENILVELHNPQARREVILSAHYDTKTEFLDHRKRMFLLKSLPVGIGLTLLLGVLAPLEAWLRLMDSPGATSVWFSGVVLSLPLLFLAWSLGLNLVTGRLLPPSHGAVDDGAACAIVLSLAERLSTGDVQQPENLSLSLALFSGEEIGMQGSRAYVKDKEFRLPTAALNLEVMAQNGRYVYWEQDGSVLRLQPTDPRICSLASRAIEQVTGTPAQPAGPLNSDGGSFLQAGIPSTTLGTYHKHLVDTGFHSPLDNMDRVDMNRLKEGVDILSVFLEKYAQTEEPAVYSPTNREAIS